MAGDWIKMRTSLLTNPRINGIARILERDKLVGMALTNKYDSVMSSVVTRNVMRHVTVSSLIVVWGAANEHTRDGVFSNADLSDIDDMTGIPGFGAAMVAVGWAIYDSENHVVTLPNFNEYNTSGSERSIVAKSGAQRQKEYRERVKLEKLALLSDVTSDVTSNRREEKRREDINIAPPAKKYSAVDDLVASGVDRQVAIDWIAVRKAKKSAATETGIRGVLREIEKAGMSADEGVRICCERGWAGFNQSWLNGGKGGATGGGSDPFL